MSACYAFLPVSVDEARMAWESFEAAQPDSRDMDGVDFIPAIGGSFVVLTLRQRGGLLTERLLFGSGRAAHVLRDFQSYLVSTAFQLRGPVAGPARRP